MPLKKLKEQKAKKLEILTGKDNRIGNAIYLYLFLNKLTKMELTRVLKQRNPKKKSSFKPRKMDHLIPPHINLYVNTFKENGWLKCKEDKPSGGRPPVRYSATLKPYFDYIIQRKNGRSLKEYHERIIRSLIKEDINKHKNPRPFEISASFLELQSTSLLISEYSEENFSKKGFIGFIESIVIKLILEKLDHLIKVFDYEDKLKEIKRYCELISVLLDEFSLKLFKESLQYKLYFFYRRKLRYEPSICKEKDKIKEIIEYLESFFNKYKEGTLGVFECPIIWELDNLPEE